MEDERAKKIGSKGMKKIEYPGYYGVHPEDKRNSVKARTEALENRRSVSQQLMYDPSQNDFDRL